MTEARHNPFRTFLKLMSAAALSLAALAAHAASSAAPGGFTAKDEATVSRTVMSASQIAGFLPSRGSFTFPAPYGTQGVRITNASDCGRLERVRDRLRSRHFSAVPQHDRWS